MLRVVRPSVLLAGGLVLLAGGCGENEEPKPGQKRESAPTLLLGQAQFVQQQTAEGKSKPVPGPARLVILRQDGQQWQREVVEDPDSNVFHKVEVYTDPTDAGAIPGVLTIGANAAAVKLWHWTGDAWSARTLWTTSFGGKQNRLRDYEIGDVTGDRVADIAVVTHDQGVVAVLTRSGDGWQAEEIDRKANTFIHEVELGDLDGDGLAEIYVTPSEPNRFDGTPQPGAIIVYRHTPTGFERQIVEEFPRRHPKEILVTDLDGDGRPTLLAAVEADLGTDPGRDPKATQVTIKQYRWDGSQYVGEARCTVPDGLCRFLNVGDVDGDGKLEIIASTHKQGLWLVRPTGTAWQTELIDADSGGFEHATVLADLDHDGTQEIYVVADKQQQARRYRWTGQGWDRQTLYQIEGQKITFCISAGEL